MSFGAQRFISAGLSPGAYAKHFFSGVTTAHLAKIIGDLIADHETLAGLYQVTAPTISKFDLLCLIRDAYGLNVEIVRNETSRCDRSMHGELFDRAIGRAAPRWSELAAELARDRTAYDRYAA